MILAEALGVFWVTGGRSSESGKLDSLYVGAMNAGVTPQHCPQAQDFVADTSEPKTVAFGSGEPTSGIAPRLKVIDRAVGVARRATTDPWQ